MMRHETAVRGNYKEAHHPHHQKIREILDAGLRPLYEKVLFNATEREALDKEAALISHFGRQWNGTGILLNKSPGGYNSGRTERPVCQYDLQGTMIAEFRSAKIAGEQTGANASYIGLCCRGTRKSAGGFMWTYVGGATPQAYSKAKHHPVIQLNLAGDIIAEYKSLTEAQQATNIERHNISECCRGKSKTAGGFTWRYK